MKRPAARTVDEYIRCFPAPTQRRLKELRAVIRAAAPRAIERISYGIPTFRGHRNLPKALVKQIVTLAVKADAARAARR